MSDGYDFDFDDVTPVEKRVRIKGKDYLLREAMGDAITKYDSARVRSMETIDGKFRYTGSLIEVDMILLSCCLFEVVEKTQTTPSGLKTVPVSVIKSWPNKIYDPLIADLKKFSGLVMVDDLNSLKKKRADLDERIAILEKAALAKDGEEENPTKDS